MALLRRFLCLNLFRKIKFLHHPYNFLIKTNVRMGFPGTGLFNFKLQPSRKSYFCELITPSLCVLWRERHHHLRKAFLQLWNRNTKLLFREKLGILKVIAIGSSRCYSLRTGHHITRYFFLSVPEFPQKPYRERDIQS